jgi:PAS domain S-box-containing protein
VTRATVEPASRITFELNNPASIRILHVDDDASFLKVAKSCLEAHGEFDVDTATSVDEAIEKLENRNYDAIISDYSMPEKDGLDLLKTVRERGSNIPFIIFTGKGREEIAIKALNIGADRYFNKNGSTETVYSELARSLTETVKLKQTEARLVYQAQLIQVLNEAVLGSDVNLIINYWNSAAEKMYGWKSEEVIGRTSPEVLRTEFNGTDRSTVLRRARETGRVCIEVVQYRKDGTPINVETTLIPLKDQDDQTTAYLAVNRDITERLKAERRLKESEEKYRSLFENAEDVMIVFDLKGNVASINRAIENYGFRRSDVIGKNVREFTSQEQWPQIFKDFAELATGKSARGTLELDSPVGRRHVEYISNPAWKGNEITGVQTTLRDVTERRHFEEALRESEEKFRGLFMGNPEATVYLSPDFQVLDVNPCFSTLFGYSPEEAKGKNINDLVVPEGKMHEAQSLDRKAAEGYARQNTVRRRKDGTMVHVSISAAPVSVGKHLLGYVGTYKDITELKIVEMELRETMQKMATINEKLHVLGGLTRHDIRNKLSEIIGNVYLVKKRTADRPEVMENLKDITSAAQQIVDILEFARNYERLGAEEMTYMDVEQAFARAASRFSQRKSVQLINDCRGLRVLADTLLDELFYNLIDNSYKYAQKLSRIRVYPRKTTDNAVELVYEDDGVGIPADEKPKLFREGYGKGTGYGLYLIKKMMEAYGWTIQETGRPGNGVQFVMKIPHINKDGKENYQLP